VLIHGKVDTYAKNIHVSVNGEKANINGNQFVLRSLPLEPGGNEISVQVVDSFRNNDQAKISVFYDNAANQEWIELVPEHPAFFQPMKIKMKVVPHLQNDLNQDSATLNYDGPGAGVITLTGSNEYSLRFDTPGLYSINYSATDIQRNQFSADTMLSVMQPFNEQDFQKMNDATQELENIYLTWVGSVDITELRQQILESAQANQDFSSVALSDGALCLIFKGFIPIILDLPDPDSLATEGSSGGDKSTAAPLSDKSFNREQLDRLLKTEKCKECDLAGANLAGLDLRGGNFEGANLKGADLQNADLRGIIALRADFESADLQNADLQKAFLAEANLKGANLKKADLRGVSFTRANLESADLQEAKLDHCILHNANLQNANLQKANMVAAHFEEADLQKANLYRAVLRTAELQKANLQGADLRKADLRMAKMEGADLRGAKLQGAKLKSAFLYGALLDDEGRKYAEKKGAQFTGDNRLESE
jgi:uncharacterized protein YjbI with pentapeptide repeats